MRKLLNSAVAALISVSTGGMAANAQEICWTASEVDAAKVRNMQSMLMVAALECSRGGYGQDHLYDEFVRNNRGALVGFNDAIKLHYMHAYGASGGRDAYDHFTTALANRHAGRASENGDFCRGTDTLLRLALDARPDELVAIASDVEERPFGVGVSCQEVPRAPVAPLAARREPNVPSSGYVEVPYADGPPSPAEAPYAQVANRADEGSGDGTAAAWHSEGGDGNLPADREPMVERVAVPEPAVAVAISPPNAPSARVAVPDASPTIAVVPPAQPVIVAMAAPAPMETRAVAVAPVVGPSPAAALAAAAQALQAAAEALKASTVEAPLDAAPVIRERAPARKL